MLDSVTPLSTIQLARYLEARIVGFKGPIQVEQFAVGRSNPTFLIKAQSGNYVLRRQPPGPLLKSAHAVDREYRVIEALGNTDVPVPRAHHLSRDLEVIGSMFYVMSFESGRIFSYQALPELDRGQRLPLYDEMIRVLGALHNLNPEAIGLGDYGRPGNYFERQIGRMTKQYRAAETESIPAMEELMSWLSANTPADDGQVSLIHGDYHFSNIIFHPTEPRIKAVLDWELSTLGHPLADLAYFCMGLRLPDTFVIRGLAGKDRGALGLPIEQEIIEHYGRIRNIGKIERWAFYLAFSFFRLAAIVQGVKKRGTIGTASHREEALQLGDIPSDLARMAIELIDREL
jgi:aminoglycoside phosphotransferase (APT) family kinase protein